MAVVPREDAIRVGRDRSLGAWAALIPTWPLWLALAGFVRLLAQPTALLNDPDTYLHIAAGRWIIAHHALPLADPFSYTMSGAPWLPGEWLAQLVMAAVYDTTGWTGIILLAAACFAAALALLCHFLVPRIGSLPAVIATLAGAALVLPHTVARPHLLALPLLALWCGSLVRARDEGGDPRWALLPVIVVWANIHASFLFGLGFAGWLAGEAVLLAPPTDRKRTLVRWGSFVAAGAIAGLATPGGPATFLQPLRLMAMPALAGSFGEWLPPSFSTFPALEWWLLGVVGLGFAMRIRLRWPRLLLLLLLMHMALRHVRHADLLGLVGPLVMASAVGEALGRHGEHLSRLPLWRAASVLAGRSRPAMLATAAILAGIAAAPILASPIVRDDDAVTPAAAVSAARRLGLSGPVFNSEEFGGYLAFSGLPDFIDGRVEMFGNDLLAEDVAAESGDTATLARLLGSYRVSWTLLTPQAGAVAVLDRMSGWRRAYTDPYAVIHIRTSHGAD
ncbi:MAG TPA: hypothetical protein VHW66_04285 [Stellaceae bacterium]|nr:hypothetical protein [Stellaceae bacterium]